MVVSESVASVVAIAEVSVASGVAVASAVIVPVVVCAVTMVIVDNATAYMLLNFILYVCA